VTRAAADATYVHFACHAYFEVGAPWSSGVVMSDRDLSAAELAFAGDAGTARVVALSACETGVTDVRRAPNEYGGLPVAFVISGADAVVSTLWPVIDVSTALLMSEFCRRNVEGDSVGRALRGAQLWLRSATAAALVEWAETQTKKNRGLRPSEWRIRRGLRRLRRELRQSDPQSRPYESPDHWAAFVALTVGPAAPVVPFASSAAPRLSKSFPSTV